MIDPDGRDADYYQRRVLDHAPAVIAYWDRDLRCRYASRACEVSLGLGPGAMLGRSMRELLGEAMFARNAPHAAAALAGASQMFERNLVTAHGAPGRPTLATYTPDVVDGLVVGFIAQLIEVSAVKDAQIKLEAAVASLEAEVHRRRTIEDHLIDVQQSLAVTLASIGAGYIATDRDGKITRVNAIAEQLFGWIEAEARGRDVFDVYQREGRSAETAAMNVIDTMIENGVTIDIAFEIVAIARNGRRTPVEAKASLTYADGGEVRGAVLVFRDLSRFAASEAQRDRAEERFRQVVEAAPNGMLVSDRNGQVTLVNRTAEALLGRPRDELVGQPIEHLVPRADGAASAPDHEAVALRRRDGTELALEVTRAAIEDDGSSLTSIVDVTERKRFQDELQRSNTELEQFAYVASHDLQEPLRMVASYTELLGQRYKGKLDAKADKYIHYAVDGAQRMQRLVTDLLAYSRVESQGRELAPVAMAPVIDRVLNMFGSKLRAAGATVEVGTLPTVMADAEQLFLLFQNLVGNAVKFHGEAPPVIEIAAALERDRWRISVRDNGIGIDPQYAARIFQMFQRLHARGVYEGSGIGLTIVKRIVERHRGRIWVDSRPGEGATFHFTLVPAAAAVPF